MYMFYEYFKCIICCLVKKELIEFGLIFEVIDIKSNFFKVLLLKELLENLFYDFKKFFNILGNFYRELGLKDKFDDLIFD